MRWEAGIMGMLRAVKRGCPGHQVIIKPLGGTHQARYQEGAEHPEPRLIARSHLPATPTSAMNTIKDLES
jgi:hypothetical protein